MKLFGQEVKLPVKARLRNGSITTIINRWDRTLFHLRGLEYGDNWTSKGAYLAGGITDNRDIVGIISPGKEVEPSSDFYEWARYSSDLARTYNLSEEEQDKKIANSPRKGVPCGEYVLTTNGWKDPNEF